MKKMFRSIPTAYRNAGIALVTSLPVLAMAQTTDPFDAAVTSATTKIEAYGGALVGLAAVAVIFFIAIKYVKKISKAA